MHKTAQFQEIELRAHSALQEEVAVARASASQTAAHQALRGEMKEYTVEMNQVVDEMSEQRDEAMLRFTENERVHHISSSR